jgi:hypothetical protein
MGLLPGRRFLGSSIATPPRRVVTIVLVSGAGVAGIQYNMPLIQLLLQHKHDKGCQRVGVGGLLSHLRIVIVEAPHRWASGETLRGPSGLRTETM